MKKAPSGAFFISREADAEHGQSAYTCPLPTRHGPLFCPLERRGPRSAERWQDSRTMYDSEALDAKMPPPWQRSRAMYPKSPDCIPKRIHGTKILPSSTRKECISRGRCQGGGIFAQSAKRGCIAREYCHISQNNLMDTTKQWADVAPAQRKTLEQQPNRLTPRRNPQDHCS